MFWPKDREWREHPIDDGDIILKSGKKSRSDTEETLNTGVVPPIPGPKEQEKSQGDSIHDTLIGTLSKLKSKDGEGKGPDELTVDTITHIISESLPDIVPDSLIGQELRGKYKVTEIIIERATEYQKAALIFGSKKKEEPTREITIA